MDFSIRYTGREIMDGPEIIPGSFEKAYRDIGRCNRMLGGHQANLREVKRADKQKQARIVYDLGLGQRGWWHPDLPSKNIAKGLFEHRLPRI